MVPTNSGDWYSDKQDGVVLGSKPEAVAPKPEQQPVDDFGFSIGDAPVPEKTVEEVLALENATLKAENKNIKMSTRHIANLFLTLLNKLAENPEKDVIIWKGPARLEKINTIKAEINKAIQSYDIK